MKLKNVQTIPVLWYFTFMYLQTILCSTLVCPKYFDIAVLQVCNGINIPDNYELWLYYAGSSPMLSFASHSLLEAFHARG